MSTPTKNNKSKRTSQTARILESVELLLALQEAQESSLGESQGQTRRIAEQLEKLETKLSDLSKHNSANESVAEAAPTAGDWEARFEQLEFRIAEQLEQLVVPANQSAESLVTIERLNDFELRVITQIEERFSKTLERSFQSFEESQAQQRQAQQLDSAKGRSESSQPSESTNVLARQTTQLLAAQQQCSEQLELISAQLEELQLETQASFDPDQDPADRESMADLITTQVAGSVAELLSNHSSSNNAGKLEFESALQEQLQPIHTLVGQVEGLSQAVTTSTELDTAALSSTLSKSILEALAESDVFTRFEATVNSDSLEALEVSLHDKLEAQSRQFLDILQRMPEQNGSESANGLYSVAEQQQLIESFEATKDQFTQSSKAFDSTVELLMEQIDSKTAEVAEAIENRLDKRFETLSSQMTKVESQYVFDKEASAELGATATLTLDEVSNEVQRHTGLMLSELKSHLDAVIEDRSVNSGSKDAVTATGSLASSVNPAVAPSEDEDSVSHWNRQKRAMLEKYGIDPEYRPLEGEKAKREAEPAGQPEKRKQVSSADRFEELHQSINKISDEDNEAIESLKKELNSKLRDAEVELSINRAKLSQEKAELEQKHAELERRAADLESKLASAQEGDDQSSGGGFMSRIARHLGRGK